MGVRVNGMRVLELAFVVLVLSSCGTPEERQAIRRGASAGGTAFVGEAGRALTAYETGGLSAAAIALVLGAVKAVQKGLKVSRESRVKCVAEGVKLANGKSGGAAG